MMAPITLALAAGACQPAEHGAIDVVVIGEPPRLADPAEGPLSAGESVLLANVAQGLVRFDARGQIVPGLAERWNVSDDGLSYIFRLATDQWPNGERITAEQVARILRRQTGRRSANPLKDSLGAVAEIVAMTDRVLEIRLTAPRPQLLQLLAQPEMAILRNGQGTGPFELAGERRGDSPLLLRRTVALPDGEGERTEEMRLAAAPTLEAIRRFTAGEADLVVGGTFAELPLARTGGAEEALHFDPVAGLFGLAPARSNGPIADPEVRRLLDRAIDREALIRALDVPGLRPRATILESGLDGVADPAEPEWAAIPIAERLPQLAQAADQLFGRGTRPTIRIDLPRGPGAELLLGRLKSDWGQLGLTVERASSRRSADLVLIDSVAPSTSPAWYLRRWRCGVAPLCDEQVDELMAAARAAPVADQRGALLAEAARLVDEQQLFLPIAAPVRWALVAPRIVGFAGNRFGRHPLTGLGEKLSREGPE